MDYQHYAVINTGNKQYQVSPGDVIDIELLEGAEAGKPVEFEVLYYRKGELTRVGAPLVAGALVRGEVIDNIRGPKVIAYKYKKRKNFRKKKGHRQNYNRVKITELFV